jgi:hypothetical protein
MLRCILVAVTVIVASQLEEAKGSYSYEVGSQGMRTWTGDKTLGNQYGLGLYVVRPVSKKVSLRLEYDYSARGCDEFGHARLPIPPWYQPQQEYVHCTNRFHSVQFGFLHTLSHAEITSLSVGIGIAVAGVGQERRGLQTGVTFTSEYQKMVGLVLDANLLVDRLIGLPLVMRTDFRHRFFAPLLPTKIGGYSPFDDNISTTEFHVGFGYQFGKKGR